MEIVCPECGGASPLTADLDVCACCGRKLRDASGMLDFVGSPERAEERRFYDGAYVKSRTTNETKQAIESVSGKWERAEAPENRIVRQEVGNLAGKNVLLLGNGDSVKELIFLKMNPRHLVYSDLSTQALVNIDKRFDLRDHRHQLTFAAVDAHSIPFTKESFDLVYGFAMVHHLPDLDRFFGSVMKALRPGGRTVFLDDAFAPLWHWSKQTWLKPLMKKSHNKTGISPEDYRFSMSGGFKEEELAEKIRRAGGEPYFIRSSFLTYLFYRGAEKLLPRGANRALRQPSMSRAVGATDRMLCRLPLFRKNQIRLVWGFTKP